MLLLVLLLVPLPQLGPHELHGVQVVELLLVVEVLLLSLTLTTLQRGWSSRLLQHGGLQSRTAECGEAAGWLTAWLEMFLVVGCGCLLQAADFADKNAANVTTVPICPCFPPLCAPKCCDMHMMWCACSYSCAHMLSCWLSGGCTELRLQHVRRPSVSEHHAASLRNVGWHN